MDLLSSRAIISNPRDVIYAESSLLLAPSDRDRDGNSNSEINNARMKVDNKYSNRVIVLVGSGSSYKA